MGLDLGLAVSIPLSNQPLHAQSPTTRFDDRVADYVRFRPTYPGAAIDAVLRHCASPERLVVADVGAGTGISSRLLADRGVRVLAVEPNESMAREIGGGEKITWIRGTAESTTLGDESVDCVVCAQAFHWFQPEPAMREFRRVLRPSGWLALMWNIRDESDGLTSAYTRVIREVIGTEPAEMRGFDEEVLDRDGFSLRESVDVPHQQSLDETGFIGRATSAWYVPKSGVGFEKIVSGLRTMFAAHEGQDGRVTMRYRTRVYIADRA